MSDYDVALGARISASRRAAGLSQSDVATALGMTGRSSVANYERGHQTVSAERVVQIAAAIGCDPRWLLTGWDAAEPVLSAWVARRAVVRAREAIMTALAELEGTRMDTAEPSPGSGAGYCHACDDDVVPGDLNTLIEHIRVMHPDDYNAPQRWPDGGLVVDEDPDPAAFATGDATADTDAGASID